MVYTNTGKPEELLQAIGSIDISTTNTLDFLLYLNKSFLNT